MLSTINIKIKYTKYPYTNTIAVILVGWYLVVYCIVMMILASFFLCCREWSICKVHTRHTKGTFPSLLSSPYGIPNMKTYSIDKCTNVYPCKGMLYSVYIVYIDSFLYFFSTFRIRLYSILNCIIFYLCEVNEANVNKNHAIKYFSTKKKEKKGFFFVFLLFVISMLICLLPQFSEFFRDCLLDFSFKLWYIYSSDGNGQKSSLRCSCCLLNNIKGIGYILRHNQHTWLLNAFLVRKMWENVTMLKKVKEKRNNSYKRLYYIRYTYYWLL